MRPTGGTSAATRPSSASTEIPLQFYQIAIEAIVVEINEKYTRQIGLQYTYSRDAGEPSVVRGVDVNNPVPLPSVIVPQMGIIPGGVNFTGVNRTVGAGLSLTGMSLGDGQVGVRLRALIEEGKAQIRSRPLAITLNKQMVKIETVDKIPYQDVIFAPGGIGQMSIQFEPVGVKLHVLPDIKSLPEGLIDLDLAKLEVSAVRQFVHMNNVQRPLFLRSEANTKVVVRNRDTLVIGGFKIEENRDNGQGVPFVRRIPVLKYLFSNENKRMDRRDILFYLTPHILPPGIQPTVPSKFEHAEAITGVMQLVPPPSP